MYFRFTNIYSKYNKQVLWKNLVLIKHYSHHVIFSPIQTLSVCRTNSELWCFTVWKVWI